jgi:hypothetical protein
VTEYEATCAATVGCHHVPAVGLICRGHLARLGAMLRDIEDEAVHLSAVPSMQQRTSSGHGSPAFTRSPARLDVLVHRDPRSRLAGQRLPGPHCPSCWHDSCTDIRAWIDAYDVQATETLSVLDVLASWASIVREERDLVARWPVTVTGERDTLTRQLDWIAEQPWVDEFHSDLTTLLGQLRAANGTVEDKPVGRCYLPKPEGLCDGPIWVDMVAGHAYCARCREAWDGPRLAILRHNLEEQRREDARPRTEDGRPMLTAEELVAQGKVSSVSNVRVTAHRLGKVSVDGHYDPEWFRGKVSA